MGGNSEIPGRSASDSEEDDRWMALAVRQAERALAAGEVPIGAVIVAGGTVIARAHNQNVLLRDPTAHAEMLAYTQAAAALENDRLTEATLYVTVEPCAMCAGAAVLARLRRVVFGAADPKAGACGSVLEVLRHPKLNHRPAVRGGVLAEESARLMREFFAARRRERGAGAGDD
jgi:tRNA(adenine34) deaminase